MSPAAKHTIGVLAAAAVAAASHAREGPAFVAGLDRTAQGALARAGGEAVRADFTTQAAGLRTRHAALSTERRYSDEERRRFALAVAAAPGVGGVRWVAAPGLAAANAAARELAPDHCQKGVEALLAARTIRFREGRAALDPSSEPLLAEVAAALRPCRGSRVEIAGHSDSAGDKGDNKRLSQLRAETVRLELIRLGLAPRQLAARGYGAERPVEGLAADDPANRRIEFTVLEPEPLRPTPIDTPEAG